MPCEPNDLHASHVYAKRNRKMDLEGSENEEENPETPKNKKKVKKLKEKSQNLANKNYSQMPNIASLIKEQPNNPLYSELSDIKQHHEKLFSVSPSNLIHAGTDGMLGDAWKMESDEGTTCHKKFKNKHGVVSSSFKTPHKMPKNAHNNESFSEDEKENEEMNLENLINLEDDFEFNNFEDILANFGIDNSKNCKNEIKIEECEEEEEDNQEENDFENKDFIDDFNGYHYNE